MKRIAIVGAGMAGLTLACLLSQHAHVRVFEKSRGVGGRMSTRRIGDFSFDHGAQFFTVRSLAFRHFLQTFLAEGIVQEWRPRVMTLAEGEYTYKREWFEPHYVAVPGMTALCKAMAEGTEIHLDTPVGIPQRQHGGGWRLPFGTTGLSDVFDWILCTAPAPQARVLLPQDFAYQAKLEEIVMNPCITMLVGLREIPSWNFDAARIKHQALDWVSCEASRPGRSQKYAITVHSTGSWAASQLHTQDEHLTKCMLDALRAVTGKSLPPIAVQMIKRWHHAKSEPPEEPLLLLDNTLQLAACGDWTHHPSVEGAFLSAHKLVEALKPVL